MKTGKRVVICGAGFGGLLTALRLYKCAPELDVVLIDRSSNHVYKPWLYDVATSMLVDAERRDVVELSRSAIFSIPNVLEANRAKNVRFRKASIEGVDTATKHVLLSDGKTIAYDVLVLALGAQVNYFGIQGMEKHSQRMVSVEDAMDVRSSIEAMLRRVHEKKQQRCTTVIVGAGPTGTEMAAELANFLKRCDRSGLHLCHACRIILMDAGERVLGPFSLATKTLAERRLDRLGVEIHVGTLVTHVDDKLIHAQVAKTGEELTVPYDTLIWAGGVRPNALLTALSLPLSRYGRLDVDKSLRVRGREDVFALGDCAAFVDTKNRELPQTAWAAIEASRVVARNVHATFAATALQPYKPYKNWPAIITVGGERAVAQLWGIVFFGRLAFCLRRLVDLRYFLKILPVGQAIRTWRRGIFMLSKND